MSKLLKKELIFCLVAAFVLCGAGNLMAGEVKTSDDKVSVSLYGQVTRAMALINDGEESYLTHVDNDNSSTRFGFKAKAKGSDTLTIGANMEFEYQQNSSDKMTQASGTSNADLAKRKLEAYFDFAKIGKFSLGHGPTASDSTSEVDLSGTAVAAYSRTNVWAGGYFFYDTSAAALSSTTVANVINNLDGNGRQDRFRYDSPKFGGFMVSASTFEVDTTDTNANITDKHDPAYDLALRYSGKFGDDVKMAAAVAYSDYPSTDTANAADKTVNGSLSVLFSGISVTFAAGQRDLANVATTESDTANFYYGKLGYMANFWSVGTTAFALDYGKHDEFSRIKGDEATTYAFYVNQKLNAYSTEVYTGYRIHKLDDRASTGETFEDIGAFFLGARIKF